MNCCQASLVRGGHTGLFWDIRPYICLTIHLCNPLCLDLSTLLICLPYDPFSAHARRIDPLRQSKVEPDKDIYQASKDRVQRLKTLSSVWEQQRWPDPEELRGLIDQISSRIEIDEETYDTAAVVSNGQSLENASWAILRKSPKVMRAVRPFHQKRPAKVKTTQEKPRQRMSDVGVPRLQQREKTAEFPSCFPDNLPSISLFMPKKAMTARPVTLLEYINKPAPYIPLPTPNIIPISGSSAFDARYSGPGRGNDMAMPFAGDYFNYLTNFLVVSIVTMYQGQGFQRGVLLYDWAILRPVRVKF
ncbi:uncharacterized protein BDR25DRAFT_350756 [Lindgomyces ingoldianus]|uniref:Uncharacterized protein n=1 Tax=Lindgomyces ingoldianus TaxID=673940 RepID=A0ACB6R7Z2_9PLEO|nr:uncharacterized protein BDR25DRAFT_350756 [Lindgomyces ingoldianus]KAF2475374.1 hypothetical protein BDR25DRAFT_350756 [Lindgomyces ingoldianus]